MGFRYVLAPDGRVDPADRGLAYGDGLFETMAVRDAVIQRLDLHLDRLRTGAARLRLPLPEHAVLEDKLNSACDGLEQGTLKLILTRGSGPRGYAPPPNPEPTIILFASAEATAPAVTITTVTLQQRLSENETLAGIKHLCRLEQVLGQLELGSHDADEGLMLSSSGHVIGGTSRNLFAVFGRRLVTPEVGRAGIRGVMRRAVIDRCDSLDLEVVEAELRPHDLLDASEIFMTNALVGVQSVSSLDGRALPSRAIAMRLRGALELDRHD